MRHERALASLALLKVLWDEQHRDHIDSFVPLFLLLIERRKWRKVPPLSEAQRAFADEWGLEIPIPAIATIVNRCRTRGFLRRAFNEWHVVVDRLAQHSTETTAASAFATIQHTISSFQAFAEQQFDTVLSEGDAQQALISFLRDHDLEMLFSTDLTSVLPRASASKASKYLFASFASSARQNDPPQFAALVAIAAGHILANTISFPKIENFKGKLRNLRVYLDAPLIFQALGLATEEEELAAKDLLRLLNDQEVTTLVFQHTLEEVNGILENAMRWLDNLTAYDPGLASRALRFFVERGYKPSDVEEIIGRLGVMLSSLKVEVAPTPNPQEHAQYQIDELSFEKLMSQNYRGRTHPSTILLDIKSVASIYRLRKDHLPRSINETKYILCTTNHTLALTAREYEERWTKDNFFVPACITDVFLGTLIWLQSPSTAEGLNSARLIADCQIAMEPSSQLFEKYARSVENLRARGKVTADEYFLLRTSRVARQLLERKTLSDPDNFSIKTTEDILLEIKRDIQHEEHARAEGIIAEMEAELRRVQAAGVEETKRRQKVESGFDRLSRLTSQVVMIVIFIAGVPAIVLLVTFTQSESLQNYHPVLRKLAWIIAISLTVISLTMPFNLWSFAERVRAKIEVAVRNRLIGPSSSRDSS